jgi:hypothetical protein
LVPDRDIGLAFEQVDHRVGADDLKRDFGVGLPPHRQARHQPSVGECVGRSDPPWW